MRFGVDIGGTNIKFVVIDGEEIKYQNHQYPRMIEIYHC